LPQLARVRKVLDSHKYGHLPVQGFLCFVEADWQLPATPLRFGSVRVVWPRELIKAIDSEQSEEPLLVHPVAQALAQAFPER
jgi:hypothetical protein